MKKAILLNVILLSLTSYAQSIMRTEVGAGTNLYRYELSNAAQFPGYYFENNEWPEDGYSYMWVTSNGSVSHQMNPEFYFNRPGDQNISLILTPRKRPQETQKITASHFATGLPSTNQNTVIDDQGIYFDTEAKPDGNLYLVVPLSSCDSTNTQVYNISLSNGLIAQGYITTGITNFTQNNGQISFAKDWNGEENFHDKAAVIRLLVTGDIDQEVWAEFVATQDNCQKTSYTSAVISAGPFDPNYKESSISEINLSENQQPRETPTTVRYTIHFQNIGQGSVDSVTVTDVLPAYLTYLGNEASSHSSTPYHNGSSLKWVMGSMTNPNLALDIKGTNDPRQWPEPETKGWVSFDAQISRVNEILDPKDTCYCLCNTATIYFDSLEHIVTQANIIAIGDSVCFKPLSQGKEKRWVDEICYDDANFYKTASIKDIINGNKNNEQVTIYPNPTTSVFHIVDISLTPATIEITNHLGQQIEPMLLDSNTIDISQQPAGFYYIRILTKQGTYTARVIKN